MNGSYFLVGEFIDLISNGVRGIHIYTMNKPATAKSIMQNIDAIIAACNE